MADRTVGVDVGGTKVSVATLGDEGLSEPIVAPTDTSSAGALIDQLTSTILAVSDGAAAVGIGVPSVVEWETGRVRSSVNIPLADVPLRQVLGERVGLPVFVDNDATVAAFAEAHDDRFRLVTHNLVMFTVGTGVGGGIVTDGRVFRGSTGAAPELGHIIIGLDLRDGAPAAAERFPQPGSLESLASGRALGLLGAERGYASGPEVTRAARAGEEAAIEALRIVGSRLGIGIASMINAFDPDVVCIGGGVSAAGELLLEPAKETALRYVLPGVGTQTEIRMARYLGEAGVLGAALLARHESIAPSHAERMR